MSLLTFPDDKKLFKLLENAIEKNSSDCIDIGRETQQEIKILLSKPSAHAFVLPTELRDGSITTAHVARWLNDACGIGDEEKNTLLFGVKAIKKGIDFFFEEQDDDDFDIKNGKRAFGGSECHDGCPKEQAPRKLYSCCDFIYPLQTTWFTSFAGTCEACHLLPEIDRVMEFTLPRELIQLIKNYLQPIYTMAPVEDGMVTIKTTSVITEWLPIVYHDSSYDQAVVIFLNCNPASKFYRYSFSFQHERWETKVVHLRDIGNP